MKVRISGVEIPVELVSKRKMKNDYGQFISDEEIIRVREDQPVRMRRKTLVHEICHAYLFISGFSELLISLDDNMEEAFCRSFEQSFPELFRFDPEIEAWIEGK